MLQSGHLTIEDCKVEMRELESRERKINGSPNQRPQERPHTTVVPHRHKRETQEQKQPVHAEMKKTAPSQTMNRRPQGRKMQHTTKQSEEEESYKRPNIAINKNRCHDHKES